MIIIEKNVGQKVQYEQNGTVIIFADGEIAINCALYQKDWGVHLDICSNIDDNLAIGTTSGQNYVAQVDIPARGYIYPEPVAPADPDGDEEMDGVTDPPTPIPLDMETVTLTLWAIGALTKGDTENA